MFYILSMCGDGSRSVGRSYNKKVVAVPLQAPGLPPAFVPYVLLQSRDGAL